jgi:RNA polymerase sigma factor for flagellar operon FliA
LIDAKPIPWSDVVCRRESTERERFLESHIDLVKFLALRIAARLPANVELSDLVNDGVIGLLDATEKYDPARGVRFRTYAESRVRGAILDGLRRKDWRPRSVRLMQRQLDETLVELSTRLQRPSDEEEVATAMRLDLRTYRSLLRDVNTGPLLSLDDLPEDSDPTVSTRGHLPDEPLVQRDLLEALADEILRLPERERRILGLYYHEALNMKEVGAVLGVTESRVCQLHSQATARLRSGLTVRLRAEPTRRA